MKTNECEVIALRIKKYLFPWLFGFALLGFTTYLLLDTFVLVRKYMTVQESPPRFETTEIEIAAGTDSETTDDTEESAVVFTEPVSTDTSYTDGNIAIVLTEYRIADTTVHVADVTLRLLFIIYSAKSAQEVKPSLFTLKVPYFSV